MSGPRILVGDDTFRIVRVEDEDGERVSHVLEVPDACDALGVERWREVRADTKGIVGILFTFLIKQAVKQEQH